jgi:hypothetical protein
MLTAAAAFNLGNMLRASIRNVEAEVALRAPIYWSRVSFCIQRVPIVLLSSAAAIVRHPEHVNQTTRDATFDRSRWLGQRALAQ